MTLLCAWKNSTSVPTRISRYRICRLSRGGGYPSDLAERGITTQPQTNCMYSCTQGTLSWAMVQRHSPSIMPAYPDHPACLYAMHLHMPHCISDNAFSSWEKEKGTKVSVRCTFWFHAIGYISETPLG